MKLLESQSGKHNYNWQREFRYLIWGSPEVFAVVLVCLFIFVLFYFFCSFLLFLFCFVCFGLFVEVFVCFWVCFFSCPVRFGLIYANEPAYTPLGTKNNHLSYKM